MRSSKVASEIKTNENKWIARNIAPAKRYVHLDCSEICRLDGNRLVRYMRVAGGRDQGLQVRGTVPRVFMDSGSGDALIRLCTALNCVGGRTLGGCCVRVCACPDTAAISGCDHAQPRRWKQRRLSAN